MKIIGIDYGRRKIGLAVASTILAETYGVLRYENIDNVINKLKKIIDEEKVEKIVLGLSEGKMAEETKHFAEKLEKEVALPVEFHDETLSTKMSQQLAIQAGIKRKKRKELEDAYAATYLLQDYLDLSNII